MKKLNPPKFEEDLRSPERLPLWMSQMERSRNTEPSGSLGLALLTLTILAALVALGFLICK